MTQAELLKLLDQLAERSIYAVHRGVFNDEAAAACRALEAFRTAVRDMLVTTP